MSLQPFRPFDPFRRAADAAGAGFDPDALDYFSRAEALGGSFDQTAINSLYTEAYCKAAISDCIAGLKTDAVWAKIIELYIHGFVTFAGLVAKLKHAGTSESTNVGPFVSGDYLAAGSGAGLKADANVKWLTHGEPSSGLRGLMAYCTVAPASEQDHFVGIDSFPSTNRVGLFYSATQVSCAIGAATFAPATTGKTGFFIASRTSSTSLKLYKNGSLVATNTSSVTFTAPTSGKPLYSFNAEIGGSPVGSSQRSDARLICTGYTEALDDTEAANLSSRINALMTAIGANVY